MDIKAIITDKRLLKYGLPQRATDGSAGADLRAMLTSGHPQVVGSNPMTLNIYPGQTIVIDTGIRIHIDDMKKCGLIFARSGLASKRGLAPANKVGLIDSDYQGPLKVALHNYTSHVQTVEQGERIAQLVIAPVVNFNLVEVDSFEDETERGEGGFGSTGER